MLIWIITFDLTLKKERERGERRERREERGDRREETGGERRQETKETGAWRGVRR